MENEIGSREVAKVAMRLSLTSERDEEKAIVRAEAERNVKCAAADFGGEFVSSVTKIIGRAVLTAKKAGIISETHAEEGAVAGAAKEALAQVMNKAIGFNVGGKIAVARFGEHIAVAVFFGIGMLDLNEVAAGLGHRVV